MADGNAPADRDLEVGDAIYGTQVGEPSYRRYVRTTVLDKWITVKPAYRVTLESGTELIVSGDHRFLSNRGWKHVANSASGRPDRPHLTTRNRLVGTGPFEPQPIHDADYRRGYLCGIVRGDGTLGAYERQRRRRCVLHRVPLPTRADGSRGTSPSTRVPVRVRPSRRVSACFNAPWARHREMSAITAQSATSYERISRLIEWPLLPSLQWCRGFLAGIFDAEGSSQCLCPEDRQHRSADSGLDRGVRSAARHSTSPSIGHEERKRPQVRADSGWSVRAPSVLPPRPTRQSAASGTSRGRWSRRSKTCG